MNKKKTPPSLREAFDAGRVTESPNPSTDSQDVKPAHTEKYPGPKGRKVPAYFPVNMTFTITAKERYDLNLAMRKRGTTATQFLRDRIAELED